MASSSGTLHEFQFWPFVEWSAQKNAVSGSAYPGVVFIVMSKSWAIQRLIQIAYSTFSISTLMPMRLSWAAMTGAPDTIVGNVGITMHLTVKRLATPASAMSFFALSRSGL